LTFVGWTFSALVSEFSDDFLQLICAFTPILVTHCTVLEPHRVTLGASSGIPSGSGLRHLHDENAVSRNETNSSVDFGDKLGKTAL
jgi:hypothetical protein